MAVLVIQNKVCPLQLKGTAHHSNFSWVIFLEKVDHIISIDDICVSLFLKDGAGDSVVHKQQGTASFAQMTDFPHLFFAYELGVLVSYSLALFAA